MKAREWWIDRHGQAWDYEQPAKGDLAKACVHVIEAAPVLAEIKRLEQKVKELQDLIDLVYAAQNG